MNPDGYVYNSDSGGASANWRKNRRIIQAPYVGVDLNRNYGYRWGVDNYGSSPNPPSETYRGPSPFSEPETQVARDLMINQKIRTQMDYHTYGQYNMYPWNYSTIAPPDSLTLKEMVDTFRLYNQYLPGNTGQGSRVLYLSNGCSDDWEYADTLWQGNQKFVTYAFCIEWGRTDFWYGWNNPAYVDSECLKNRPNSLYLTRLAGVFFEPSGIFINDSLRGNQTNQLDPGETAYVWMKLRNRAVHPLDSAYQLTGKLKSMDTMVIILDSIKTFPTCLSKDSTDNRTQQFKFYCRQPTNPGQMVNLRLEMSFQDDTLSMMQPVNFSILIGANPVFAHDVGCTKIEGIPTTLDSGAIVTPACSVYNYGITTEDYSVRMKIGNFYNRTASISAHVPGTYRYVTFPACTAYQRGTNAVACSTELAGDLRLTNDKQTSSVFVQVLDVGVTAILSPPSVVDSGQTITPQARVKNFGNVTANDFPVRFTIGSWQDDTTITSLNANESTDVTFASWTATQRGIFATKCSTRLTNDMNTSNDKQTGFVSVRVSDIGIVSITLPDTINFGTAVTLICSLYNYGTVTETYGVVLKFNGTFTEILTVSSHAPGTYANIVFASIIPQPGINVFSCSLAINDMNPANDTMSKLIFVRSLDVGVTRIVDPTGTLEVGMNVTPACSVYNYGNIPITYSVRMKIGSVYNEDTLVFNHTPNTYQYVIFPTWIANQEGNYIVSCSTELAGDMNPANDQQIDTVRIEHMIQDFWALMPPVPAGNSGKMPKSGSGMAGLEATNKIYFLKASNTQDFHVYNLNPPNIGYWASDTMPLGTKVTGDGKKPKKGASIAAYEQGGCLFVLRGNNTSGFWQYQADTTGGKRIGWTKKTNIPMGQKNPKDASGLVAVTKGGNDYIFAMKGSKTNEFYLYDIANNTWALVSSPPIGASGKIGYKKGSCLYYDGDSLVYVLKGNYGDFFQYNVTNDVWTELRRYDAKFFLNRDGKKKKPKDGAGLIYYDDAVYMLKGGNTNEFWKYNIASDTWIQMGPADAWDIPRGSGKKVKGGGCLTMLGYHFYAVKGANTPEFYIHIIPTVAAAKVLTASEGIMSKKLPDNNFKLTITPNPASNITAVRYSLPAAGLVSFKLYNITGSLVKSYANATPSQDGALMIDTKLLPSGVYVMRFNSGEITVTRKLVIEK